MKIVIFSTYFLPHSGGVEQYVYQTAKRLVKKGHTVTVVTSRLPKMRATENMNGIQIIRLPTLEVLKGRFSVQLPVIADTVRSVGGADVIITHTRFYPLSFLAGWYAKMRNIPWLHIEHGAKQVRYKNPFVFIGSRMFDGTFGKWILRNAHVAAVSKASCRFVKSFGARRCDILYNGTDTKFFSGRRKKHRKTRIVYMGRLIRDKGVQDLLKATKKLGAEVIIVGDGPYKKALKKFGGKFVGKKSHAQIKKILAESDIVVNPSYAEGLPTSVLEAGAMGLAVVATDVGGTREIIDDKKNGFLIKPKKISELREKITLLLEDKKMRERFGKRLQKKVRSQFDWDATTRKLEALLKKIR